MMRPSKLALTPLVMAFGLSACHADQNNSAATNSAYDNAVEMSDGANAGAMNSAATENGAGSENDSGIANSGSSDAANGANTSTP
jgi:hypothetical protein